MLMNPHMGAVHLRLGHAVLARQCLQQLPEHALAVCAVGMQKRSVIG